ncbi:hypothetical protein ABWL39_14010 [Chitinivorax sp. PXF-14]|uniref:hypothetical protein n=1 Tax=Chitinivorax sp. PXF-14 TaxID=3230488 RepID=UPI0034659B04
MKAPTVLNVSACPPSVLSIEWSTGETLRTDIGEQIERFELLHSLRDAACFAQAAPGLWGHSVMWGGAADMGADQLYELGRQQAGLPTPAEFSDWMKRHRLTLTTAATALGLSRRMVAYYCSGSKPIPLVVGLACLGWEMRHRAAA